MPTFPAKINYASGDILTAVQMIDVGNGLNDLLPDAKGSLTTVSAANTPAQLTVGNSGETLVANSAAATGLSYKEDYAAGKNKILNADCRINQRNFTSSTAASGFIADQWRWSFSGATGTASLEAFTPGTAPVAGYEAINFLRLAITTGNDFARFDNFIEDVRTLAGQTVTLSFYAKGTNPTTAGNLKASLVQRFGSGGSSEVELTENFVLTGSWTRYSLTFTLGGMSGKTIGTGSYLVVRFGQGDSISTDAWTLDLWGVQLEAGSVATAFQTATGTLQGELAACQRYFQRLLNGADQTNEIVFVAQTTSGTDGYGYKQFFVPMRIAPSMSNSIASGFLGKATAGGNISLTALSYSSICPRGTTISFSAASGFTAGAASLIFANSSTATIDASAEL